MSFAPHLQLIFGETSTVQCRVYARLDVAEAEGLGLSGHLVGPECRHGRTLPNRYEFVARGQSGPPLAEAFIAEPCFWSTEMPHLYRAEIDVWRGQQLVDHIERWFGIRPLGTRRSHGDPKANRQASLIFAGKRFVMRAVHREHVPETDLAAWRDVAAAMIVADPDEALCEQASREGVLLIAEVAGSGEECRAEIRRLARWPAVGVVTIGGDAANLGALGEAPPNLLLAQELDAPDILPAPWASVAVCSAVDTTFFEQAIRTCPLPVLARRPADWQATLGEGRRLCDILQRDLAQFGQFAGYLV